MKHWRNCLEKARLVFLARNKTWRLKNFTIKHYLFERFYLEERIEINFNYG